MDLIKFHLKQGQAFESTKRINICCSGIQGGKTTVGATWSLKNSIGWGDGNCGIILAPTYKIMHQSTLPTWLKYAGRFGHYQKADSEFIFDDGFKVYMRTSTDPDSMEGIQNVRWGWGDELGKCKRQAWINLEGRCARTMAPIMGTTTPYGLNWLFHELIIPFQKGLRDDVDYHEWLSIDNPSFPVEEYERQKRILDPRVFRMKYMGIHERMQGLVYELTDKNYSETIRLPEGTRFFAGVDFGFTEGHEFALVVRAITPDGFHYAVDAFKSTGLEPSKQVMVCQAKQRTYGIETFYCDPARPDLIAELQKNGLSAIGFHVGRDNFKQIIPGVQKHGELIRSGRYRMFKSHVPMLHDEYETYHWPEYDESKPAKDLPVKMNDDLMDAERYVTVGTMHVKIQVDKSGFITQRMPEIDSFNPKKRSKAAKNWNSY